MRHQVRQTFSTTDVHPAVRLGRWNDFGSETFASMTVDPVDRDTFGARITRLSVGSLGLAWLDSGPAMVQGYGAGVSPWAAPTKDAFLLLVQERGRSRTAQGGREAVLEPGDMVLVDATRPYVNQSNDEMSLVVVKLPIEQLLRKLGDPAALAGMGLKAGQGGGALASSVLLSLHRTFADEPEASWGETVSDVVLDVLGMAYGRSAPTPAAPSTGLALRREAVAYIERRLGDPDLTVAGIASALGVSTRYLQRLFFDIGVTPRQYVQDRRLDAAAQHLRRSGDGASITEIAYGVGFNDLSHFTRSFAKKYGLAPREYRRARRPAPVA